MRTVYHVYVDSGTLIKDDVPCKLKAEFNQYFDKRDALEYKERLEKRYKNAVIEEKVVRNNPFV